MNFGSNLRQTLDFRPSIHQVLQALEAAKQERLIRYTDRIENIAKRIDMNGASGHSG
jgi:hypothetical protein